MVNFVHITINYYNARYITRFESLVLLVGGSMQKHAKVHKMRSKQQRKFLVFTRTANIGILSSDRSGFHWQFYTLKTPLHHNQ